MKNELSIFTESQVEEVSGKILNSTIKKITDDISGSFYKEMQSYLYEHYENATRSIRERLIVEISDLFISNPNDYVFFELRKRMFNENKEELVKVLTDEAIEKSVEDVIEKYTHSDYCFNWRWKDAIIRIISENWHVFKNDERVNSGLLRKIDQLQNQVASLQNRINEIIDEQNK